MKTDRGDEPTAAGPADPHNSPAAVKRYYEEWTDRYVEAFGDFLQAQQARDPVDLVRSFVRAAGVRGGMRVLDAGCGVGGPAITLASLEQVHVEALTISELQAGRAREAVRAARGLLGTVSVSQGDFHELPALYPPESFDVVCFMESLVHSHDPGTVIRGVRHVLRPGGVVYVKDLFRGPDHPEAPRTTSFPVEATNRQFVLQVREVGDILNLLTRSGFRLESCGAPGFEEDFTRGNRFTAQHLFQLREDRSGPWVDEGLIFLHWLQIVARRHY